MVKPRPITQRSLKINSGLLSKRYFIKHAVEDSIRMRFTISSII